MWLRLLSVMCGRLPVGKSFLEVMHGWSVLPCGRKRGVKNKRTAALERAQAKAAAKIEGVLGPQGDAHALLTAVYKDESQAIDLRVQAAKAAIAYEKPRLATVESKVGGSLNLEQIVAGP